MIFEARFSQVEAREAVVQGDERYKVYILLTNGRYAGVIEAEAFEALYAPRTIASPIPDGHRRPPRKAPQASAINEGERDGRPHEGGPSDLVLKALAKHPMSSLELVTATGLEPPQVYAACNALKKKGDIESKIDEHGDGTRRYFPVKGNL